MKGGKRLGAGRKPSISPYTAQPTLRMTTAQYQQLKALGGAAWVRQQIDAALKSGNAPLSSVAACAS